MSKYYEQLNERLRKYFGSDVKERPNRRPFLQVNDIRKEFYLMEYDYSGSTVQAKGERADNLLKLYPALIKVIQQYIAKGFAFAK